MDSPLRRARLVAAATDEVVIAAITLLVLAMALQTGAAAVAAVAVGAVLSVLSPSDATVLAVLAGGTWLAVRLPYGVLGEGGPGAATPGKRLAGLRLGGPAGRRVTYGRALLRNLVKSAMVLSVVGVVAVVAGQRWHDAAAGTAVAAAGTEPHGA